MVEKKYSIGEAAKILGQSVRTLQNWDKKGLLKALRSPTNQRLYTMPQLMSYMDDLSSNGTVGVFFGTFAPLHIGHMQEIYKAIAVNGSLILIVSGSETDRGAQIGLTLDKRLRYLLEAFKDEPNVKIAQLDETLIPAYPNGWDEWTAKLLEILHKMTNYKKTSFNFYVGEKSYVKELTKRFPADKNDYKICLQTRSTIDISATAIRENPQTHWSRINRVFRRHFSKQVLVVGSALTGKSTLVRWLARSIAAPFSEEFARSYEENSNLAEQTLTVGDYARFITGQYDANSREINSPANQGIVFLDTDAIVTRVNAKLHLTKTEQKQLEPLFQYTISQEKIDLVLVIPPIREFAANPENEKNWEPARFTFHEELMRQLDEFGLMDKVVLLDDEGTIGDSKGFLARYIHAIEAVKTFTNVEIEHLEKGE